jgi:hypothetical protein
LSARGIKYRIAHALTQQQSKAFRRWLDTTVERREAATYTEQARLRAAAAASHQRREQELLELLHAEKERALADQAKFNSMALMSEQERARLQEVVDQAEETAVIQAHHIGRLQDQLRALQAATGVPVDVTDTAVMTSLEYIPKSPKPPTTPTPLQRFINAADAAAAAASASSAMAPASAAATASAATATATPATASTGTSTSNPPSPHPGSHGTGGRPTTFTFERGLQYSQPNTPRVPVPAPASTVVTVPPAAALVVDPALYAKIQAKLGNAGSLEEAMAHAHQRIAAAAPDANCDSFDLRGVSSADVPS